MDKARRIIVDILGIIFVFAILAIVLFNYYPNISNYFFPKQSTTLNADLNYAQLDNEYRNFYIPELLDENNSTNSIIVLNYHDTPLDANIDDELTFSIPFDRFKLHMFALKKAGYETITTEDLYLFMRGEKMLPKKSFMLTFDDGIRDNYKTVDPLLRLLNYKAVMFVITGSSLERRSKYYLHEEELHRMIDSGRWDIQSHSYNAHVRVSLAPDSNLKGPYLTTKLYFNDENRFETNEEYSMRISNDLNVSKQQLKDYLNVDSKSFALPFGEFGIRHTNYSESSNVILDEAKKYYNMVFYQFKPSINKDFRANYNDELKDFYLIMRVGADNINSPEELLNIMNAGQSKDLPYVEKYNNIYDWVYVWNTFSLENNKLIVHKTEEYQDGDQVGALLYLDGSYLWRDYNYSLNIVQNNSQRLFLLSRFKNSESYAACKYTSNQVAIVTRIDNVYSEYNLKTRSVFNKDLNSEDFIPLDSFLNANNNLKISVNGNKIKCFVNDYLVTEYNSYYVSGTGGIGLRVEGADFNKPFVIVDNIKVS